MDRTNAAVRMRAALLAAIVATLALALSRPARAATITVDSLDDTGAPGVCVLRDAITAANLMKVTNGCAAGTGNDTIVFSVTGTIRLGSTLPVVCDAFLEIDGPDGIQEITIDGLGKVRVMEVMPGAELKLNHLTIADGFITNDHGGDGGGIFNDGGTLTVSNTTFSGNSAPGNSATFGAGGGIFNNGGTLTVSNSAFSGNRAEGGGAIYNFGIGTLTVTNSTFAENIAREGGAIYHPGATLTVTNSTFAGNKEVGIFNFGSVGSTTQTVTNSTFAGNGDGVINVFDAHMTVTNSTFAGNKDVAISNGSTSGASIKSTILAGNSRGNCGHDGITADAGYNISDDSTCGFAKTGSANNGDGVNPLLSPAGLADNGGPTRTIALLAGSPAIDAIPLAYCTDQASPPNPITTDQRGFKRPDAGEQVCDIGAYEFQDMFAGQPGAADCRSGSIAALTQQFGSLRAAAKALHFRSVKRLRRAIREFCAG